MELPNDPIVEISPAREKFFGSSGRMLLPSRATVETFLLAIPAGQLATTDMLRKAMGAHFQVEAVCPVTTKKALQSIARDAQPGSPFWRVIKGKGEVMSLFPGSAADQASRLAAEGFGFEAGKKLPRVENYRAYLTTLLPMPADHTSPGADR